MKYLFSIVASLFVATILFAQPSPDTLWTRTYGGGADDWGTSIQQTTDGGYVIAGSTTSFGAGGNDFYVVKTNSQGDTLWTRTFGGVADEYGESIYQTADGGYVVAGITNSFGAGAYDLYVVKTNSQGDTLWTRTYGGSADDLGVYIQQVRDGGYVIAGSTGSFGAGGTDYYLVKTNAQGTPLWTHTYGGINDEYAYSMQQTSDGGYVIAGNTLSFGAGSQDLFVVKTDSNGFEQWTHTFGGISGDVANAIRQTAEGGYVIAGYSCSFGERCDSYIVKTDAQGNAEWTRTYGGSGPQAAYSIVQTADDGYFFAGCTGLWSTGSADGYMAKTDEQGLQQWTRTFGGSSNDYAFAVQQTTDLGYVIAGYVSSFGAGGEDMFVIKTVPDAAYATPTVPLVVISIAGVDVRLNWNRVTQSVGGYPVTVTGYLVFYSPRFTGPYYYHGFTADTSYVHVCAAQLDGETYYNVIATTSPISFLAALPNPNSPRHVPESEILELLHRESVRVNE